MTIYGSASWKPPDSGKQLHKNESNTNSKNKIKDNQKAKMLGENLAHYKRMQENGTVDIIEWRDGSRDNKEERKRYSRC